MSSGSILAATMPATDSARPSHRLTLRSRLEELARVWPWVEALAAEYAISSETIYAIHLCLEEAVSNVIRHGYRGRPDQRVTVDCMQEGVHELVFTIEDEAPPFNPLAESGRQKSLATSLDELQPGGQGIRLLHKFAGRLKYEWFDGGNRLILGFTLPH